MGTTSVNSGTIDPAKTGILRVAVERLCHSSLTIIEELVVMVAKSVMVRNKGYGSSGRGGPTQRTWKVAAAVVLMLMEVMHLIQQHLGKYRGQPTSQPGWVLVLVMVGRDTTFQLFLHHSCLLLTFQQPSRNTIWIWWRRWWWR